MAFGLVANFISPDGTGNTIIDVLTVGGGWEFNDTAAFSITLDANWSDYEDETADANVVQLNAPFTLTRAGQQVYEGYIEDKNLTEIMGERVIQITCFDIMGKFLKTYAGYEGAKLFTRTTPFLELNDKNLFLVAPIGDVIFPFYPQFDSGAYVDAPTTTTLNTGINGTVLTIILDTTAHPGWLPNGLVEIDTGGAAEWVFYSALQPTGAGGKYVLTVPAVTGGRGIVGTSRVAHSSGVTITAKIPEIIHPQKAIRLEGDDGTGFEAIPFSLYVTNVDDGRFEATHDLSATYSSGLKASYAIFDSGSGDVVTVGNLAVKYLEETVANAGPGLTSAKYDLTGMSGIKITSERIDTATTTIAALSDLLVRIGLQTTEATSPVGYFWNSQTGKFTMNFISQLAQAPSGNFFEQAESIDRALTLDKVAGQVLVEYEAGVNTNLCDSTRMMHPNVGSDTIGSNQIEVAGIEYQLGPDEERHDGYLTDTTAANRNLRTIALSDGKKNDTAWGLRCEEGGPPGEGPSPGTGSRCLYCWFDTDESTFTIDFVELTFDARRISAGDDMDDVDERQPFNIGVLGVTNFDSTSPPSDWQLGATGFSEVTLHAALNYDISNTGDNNIFTDTLGRVTIQGDGIGVDCNALVITSDGFSGNRIGKVRWLLLKQVFARGRKVKTVIVTLTNNISTTADTDVLKVDAYNKLFDITNGEPRVIKLSIGSATRDVAVHLGRLALLAALQVYQTRIYVYKKFPRVPVLGDTVCCDGFTGVVMSVQYEVDASGETLTLRVLDFTGEIG